MALFCDDYGKLIRFAAVGLIVMAVFMALNGMFGSIMGEQAAFFCAYPPALLLHFSLNKYWTFAKGDKISVNQLYAYLVTVVITLIIQWLVVIYSHVRAQKKPQRPNFQHALLHSKSSRASL